MIIFRICGLSIGLGWQEAGRSLGDAPEDAELSPISVPGGRPRMRGAAGDAPHAVVLVLGEWADLERQTNE